MLQLFGAVTPCGGKIAQVQRKWRILRSFFFKELVCDSVQTIDVKQVITLPVGDFNFIGKQYHVCRVPIRREF